MNRTRRLIAAVVAAIALMLGASAFASVPSASADPICGAPGLPPYAGPNPMTPEQQCAWIAWRTMAPCNWFAMQVPAGTPGSWG